MKKVFSIIVILALLLSITGCASESTINTEPTLVVDDSIKASVKPTLGFQVCLIYGLEQGDITYTSVEEKDGFTTVTGSVHLIPMDGSDEFDANFNIVYVPDTEEDALTGYKLYSFESDVEVIMEARIPSPWELVRGVDEFGDPTGDTTLMANLEGTFSNSATTNSNLDVCVFYEAPFFSFRLIEYGFNPANYHSSLTVKIKVNDAVTTSIIDNRLTSNGFFAVGSVNDKELYNALYEALTNGEKVKFVITSGSSTYNFTLMGKDFGELVKELNK